MGQLGVVSGTALDAVLVRRLQDGDPDGSIRRALSEFPYQEMVEPILERYFLAEGRRIGQPYRLLPLLHEAPSRARQELLVVANFVEVYLAKEDHDGLVGINFLEKIQLPQLPSLFGALLAGVDYVLMGAGIPIAIPAILQSMCRGDEVSLNLHVERLSEGSRAYDRKFLTRFSPEAFSRGRVPFFATSKILADRG